MHFGALVDGGHTQALHTKSMPQWRTPGGCFDEHVQPV
jgi:hypothetical protein